VKEYDLYVTEKVRDFIQIEKNFLRIIYEEGNLDSSKEVRYQKFEKLLNLSIEASDLKNKILSDFHDVVDLQIYDPDVRLSLKKMKENEHFYSIAFYESFAELHNKNAKDYCDKWDTEFYVAQ